MAEHGKHERPEEQLLGRAPARQGFAAELRDAVSQRTVLLVVGVLLIQLAFILSYVGAFHDPKPQRIPVAVAAPAAVAQRVAGQLNAIPGHPVSATVVPSEAAAAAAVRHGAKSAALVVDPTGTRDILLVASGGGSSVVTAVEQITEQGEAAQHRTVIVRDLVPLQPGDARGLTGFYLVIGWLVGGYLVAALLGVAKGARPATTRRAVIRLLAVVPYAVLSGSGGAVIVGPVLGALTGHFLALWGLGVLLVYCAAAVTLAFQVLAGVLGIGLTVLLFVVLGNPSAGGAYNRRCCHRSGGRCPARCPTGPAPTPCATLSISTGEGSSLTCWLSARGWSAGRSSRWWRRCVTTGGPAAGRQLARPRSPAPPTGDDFLTGRRRQAEQRRHQGVDSRNRPAYSLPVAGPSGRRDPTAARAQAGVTAHDGGSHGNATP